MLLINYYFENPGMERMEFHIRVYRNRFNCLGRKQGLAALQGRFTPRVNGKRISKNVYAKTREECEEKLAELIVEMKAEIKAEKERRKQAASA